MTLSLPYRYPYPYLNLILFLVLGTATTTASADYARGMEYFRKAYAAYQAQDLNGALKLIQSAISEDTDNAQHFALLGDIYYNLQDLVGARDSWGRALRLNPRLDVVREKLDRLRLEKDVEERLEAASESIFELRMPATGVIARSPRRPTTEGSPVGTKQSLNGEIASLVPLGLARNDEEEIKRYLNEAYEAVGRDFNYYPKHKIIVLLYTAEDFAKVRSLPEWVAGVYDGKIRIPLKPIADLELNRIIWHEYTHSLIYDIARGKCPVFLNEGLAEYESMKPTAQSPQPKAQRLYPVISYFLPENFDKDKKELKGIKKDREGPGRDGEAALQLDARRFYNSCESLAGYILMIWGWEGTRAFLASIGEGRPWPEAIRAAFNIESVELEKRWLNYAEK